VAGSLRKQRHNILAPESAVAPRPNSIRRKQFRIRPVAYGIRMNVQQFGSLCRGHEVGMIPSH
jgi:hypothetical protein